jgi:hypothetical protein
MIRPDKVLSVDMAVGLARLSRHLAQVVHIDSVFVLDFNKNRYLYNPSWWSSRR